MTKIIAAYHAFPSDIADDIKRFVRDVAAFVSMVVFIGAVLVWAGHVAGVV
ncbi:hypothetical protein [Agrobacterium sp. CG674]